MRGAVEPRWRDVLRLGLAQVGIGAVAALMLSTLNRVMVVELGLLASVPSALVALHFAVQISRARLGFASDRGRNRAAWMVGGGVMLAVGGTLAAAATALMASARTAGIALACVAYALIGLGLSATGTALLAAAAEHVPARRLGAAAAALWIMMIFGIALSAGISGSLLDPFSLRRLVSVAAGVSVVALALVLAGATGRLARGHGGGSGALPRTPAAGEEAGFAAMTAAAWREPAIRRFAGFVFLAMLAFSAQDLILEPFAGRVFGFTPGESTRLASMQHGGVLLGMLGAAWLSTRVGSLRAWAAAGCLASAAAFVALAQAPALGSATALRGIVLALGVANGVFTVGGVGSMMALTADVDRRNVGLRLGIFGAAQAMAYGTGTLAGGAASDFAAWTLGSPTAGYVAVFAAEAALFAGAAWLAVRSAPRQSVRSAGVHERGGDLAALLG